MLYDQRMQRISKSLSRKYHVTVLCRKIFAQAYETDEYTIIRFDPWLKSGMGFYALINLWFMSKLIFMKYDAINAVDLDSVLPAYIVSKIKAKKLIYDAHEYFEETPEIINRSFVSRFWNRMASTILPKINYNYTVNEVLSKELEKKYGTNYESIMNVPYASQSRELKPGLDKIILYQGVLNKGRGLEQMIEAMQFIDFARLHIAGDGDIEDYLKALVTKWGLDNKVKFLGRIRPEELKCITGQAWLGINLLESASKSYYLSLANKYFDYIQARVPQLSMNFPVYQSLNESHEVAILLKNLSPDHIVTNVLNLYHNTEHYTALKKACNTAADIYIWEKEELKLMEFYNKVFSAYS